MAASERSEVAVLADQVELVDAASDFAIATHDARVARAKVVALSRRLAPEAITDEEAAARALPAAKAALEDARRRMGGRA